MDDKVTFKRFERYNLSKKELKELSIFRSELNKKATDASKEEKCLICGRPFTSFCVSHSIPRFVLNGIATEGLVLRGMDVINIVGKIKPVGIGKVLTFSSICQQCDSIYFREYENPEAFAKPLSFLEINEIAVKNYLRYIYKRKRELSQFELFLKEVNDKQINDLSIIKGLLNKIELARIDVREYSSSLNQLIKKKSEQNFYVIDEIDLDYNVHFAYQGFVALINGFDEKIINDTFNYDERYKIQRLGIVVFPFKNSTKIIVFCKDGDTRLRLFYKTYKKLSLQEKLYVINYMLLLYEEEWCVPASFDIKLLNKETMDVIMQTQDAEYLTTNPFVSGEKIHEMIVNSIQDKYVLHTKGNIYNFLSKHDID